MRPPAAARRRGVSDGQGAALHPPGSKAPWTPMSPSARSLRTPLAVPVCDLRKKNEKRRAMIKSWCGVFLAQIAGCFFGGRAEWWRRGEDSNLRTSSPVTRFPGVLLKPDSLSSVDSDSYPSATGVKRSSPKVCFSASHRSNCWLCCSKLL